MTTGSAEPAVSDYTRRFVSGGGAHPDMFTGIVVDIGTVVESVGDTIRTVRIAPTRMPETVRLGSSIACAGICLTATATDPAGFSADLSPETLARTTAGRWHVGTRLNLEYALRAGDLLDGHIVTGHVDAVAEVLEVTPSGDGSSVRIRTPDQIAAMLAPKGSVAVDGTSLTVNTVETDAFSVTLIPHTGKITTLGHLKAGAAVNLEADALARYVVRALVQRNAGDAP